MDASEIDIIDPLRYESGGVPHEQFAWLRAHDPVHWHYDPDEKVPGFWAVTTYDEVVQVSRHAELFSSHRRLSMFDEPAEDTIDLYRLMMLFMDPPQHSHQRSYVNRGFTLRIPQLRKHESDALLEMLYRHVETPEFQCRFKWQPNSVAFWDNRCAQHHAMFDYFPHRRYGHRVTVCGDKPFYRPA